MNKDYIYIENIEKKIYKQDLLDMLNVSPSDIVYVSGSLIEGMVNHASRRLGNTYSDLDLFVIRGHEDYKKTGGVYINEIKKTFFSKCNGIGCDIEVFDLNRIQGIINSISKIEINPDKRIYNTLKLPMGWNISDTNDFLTRFKYGVPIKNEEDFITLSRHIEFEKFLELKKYDILQMMDNEIEDVNGDLVQGEYETALLIVRMLSYRLMDFILTCEGIFNDRQKWTWIKMENLVQDNLIYRDIFKVIKKIQFGEITDSLEVEIKSFLKKMEEQIQDTLIEVSL